MRLLNRSMAVIVICALLMAFLPARLWASSPTLVLAVPPLPTFFAVPVATSFSVTASVVGNKAITLQGSDADGTALTFTLLSQPTHGAISGFSSSTGALIYTPAFGYSGADSFTFKVTSGGQDSNTATVSITVAADKTRIIDYVTDAGGVGQVGKVTFVLTAATSTGGGLISPASSVTAQTDAAGKYDTSVIASVNLSPKAYYQVYFQTNYSDRRLLGVYDIPVSATPIVLQSYKVTDTNLAARYTFADKASVDSLQTANANAVFQSLVPSGAVDGQVFSYDAGTQRLKTAPIRDDGTKIQLTKPLANVTADSLTAQSGNYSGTVTAQNLVGNGAGITGLAGATGGVTNSGSTSIIADNDQNGIGVVDQIVGIASITRAAADKFQLFKPLELHSATLAQIAAMPSGTLARASDKNRELYMNVSGIPVPMNGGTFNTKFFGATGDGVTDDLPYLSTAVSVLAGTGSTLEFTDGTYRIHGAWTINASDVKLVARGNVTLKQTGTTAYSISVPANYSNILIQGFKFTTTVSAGDAGTAIYFNVPGSASTSKNLKVINCNFDNVGTLAISANYGSAYEFRGNHVELGGIGQHGFYISGAIDVNTIENQIIGPGAGSPTFPSNIGIKYNGVVGGIIAFNTIKGMKDSAIQILQQSGWGVPGKIDVVHNNILDSSTGGSQVGIDMGECIDCKASYNTLSNIKGAGIVAGTGNRVDVSHNILADCGTLGSGGERNAIRLAGANTTLIKNTMTGNFLYGIRVSPGATNPRLILNEIYGGGGSYGIYDERGSVGKSLAAFNIFSGCSPDWGGTLTNWTWNLNQTAASFQYNDFDGWIRLTGKTFAALGTPANGAITYCSDCTVASPCASGGTGALAKRLNGAWVCN